MLNWAYVPYTLPLILAGLAALALSVYAMRHQDLRGAGLFTLFCLAAVEWSFTYALEVVNVDLPGKIFWSKIEYLSIAFGPLLWLAFVLRYTRRDKWLNRRVWIPISVIPIITVVLVFTNELHGLIWS